MRDFEEDSGRDDRKILKMAQQGGGWSVNFFKIHRKKLVMT